MGWETAATLALALAAMGHAGIATRSRHPAWRAFHAGLSIIFMAALTAIPLGAIPPEIPAGFATGLYAAVIAAGAAAAGFALVFLTRDALRLLRNAGGRSP